MRRQRLRARRHALVRPFGRALLGDVEVALVVAVVALGLGPRGRGDDEQRQADETPHASSVGVRLDGYNFCPTGSCTASPSAASPSTSRRASPTRKIDPAMTTRSPAASASAAARSGATVAPGTSL